MGARGKETPPASMAKNHADGGISLTRAGIHPSWHAGADPKCMGATGKDLLAGGFLFPGEDL